MTPPETLDLARRLASLSAATLHEAAAETQVLPTDLRPVWPGSTVHGPAYTVRQSPGSNLWIHRALNEAPPGFVLVVAVDDPEHGYWGELMTRAAQERGLKGVVIDGGVRDVLALEALEFPVFSSGIALRGTVKDPGAPGATGESIRIGDALVETGDLVLGDSDGVVSVPADDVDRILALADEREEREERIREALGRGERLTELLGIPAPEEERAGPTGSGDTLTRLRRLDTCTASDAMDKLSLEGATWGFRRWGPRRVVAGRAVTVELRPGPAPPGANHLGTRALAEAGPDHVIVVANQGRREGGAWGGLLTLEADLRRVGGVVVDGMLRDADEVDASRVPVLARGATPRTARRRFHEAATNEPVDIGGITVTPGCFVLADGSGAVFIDPAHVDEVLDTAEELAAREARMAAALRAGGRGPEVMDSKYEEMLDRSSGGAGP